MEKWYVFEAYNSQAAYGYGTQKEAETYTRILNRKRQTSVYGYAEIEDADTLAGLESGSDTDGFRLDEAIAEARQIKWQVMQRYFRDGDDDPLTDGYPVVYDTRAEAQATLEAIEAGGPGVFGGWMEPGAELYVTGIECSF